MPVSHQLQSSGLKDFGNDILFDSYFLLLRNDMASLYILLAIFLWSSQGAVVRLSGVDLHVLIFYSIIASLILQGAILSQRRYRKEMPGVKKLMYPVILGIVSLANSLSFFYAFQKTSIANAVLTHYTAPVIVAFFAPFFLKEKITMRIILVIGLASLGLWTMLNGFSLEESQMKGIIAGVLSGIAYAIIIIFLRLHSAKFNPLILTFFTNVTIAVLLAPFVREFPTHALWSFLLIGIVYSTIAPILYYKGLQYVSANRAAVLGYLEPVCAIIFSMLLLHEIPGTHSLIGGMLILFSGYLTIRNSEEPRELVP
jgi:drug/metabolite transporter (DMT)-like permease